MKTHKFIVVILLLTLTITACNATGSPTPPTPIAVQLSRTPKAQFGGMYDIEQNGYYTAEGLPVTFVGMVEVASVEKVLEDTAQFGVIGADDLLGRPRRGQACTCQREQFDRHV